MFQEIADSNKNIDKHFVYSDKNVIKHLTYRSKIIYLPPSNGLQHLRYLNLKQR
jgi:hypothetical protein